MKFSLLAMLMGVALLAGCSNRTGLDYSGCTYPDSPSDKAPGWVCDQPVKGLTVQAMGYSRKMASGPGMMTDVAAAEARGRLAAQFTSEIQSRLSRLTTDTKLDVQTSKGNKTNVNSRDKVERIQKALAVMTLTHARIYQTKVSPAGGLYILIGMNRVAYDQNVDRLVKNALSQKDSPELYQQFLKAQADESLDKLREQLR